MFFCDGFVDYFLCGFMYSCNDLVVVRVVFFKSFFGFDLFFSD